MNSPCRHLLVSLSCAALLFSCSSQEKGHATPEAAAELALISSYLSEIGIDEVLELPGSEEIYTLMSDFATTADPRHASRPSGVSMTFCGQRNRRFWRVDSDCWHRPWSQRKR